MMPSSNTSLLIISVKPLDKFNRTSAAPPRRSSSRPRKPRAILPHRPSRNSCTPKEMPPRRSSSRPRLQRRSTNRTIEQSNNRVIRQTSWAEISPWHRPETPNTPSRPARENKATLGFSGPGEDFSRSYPDYGSRSRIGCHFWRSDLPNAEAVLAS